MDSLHSDGGLAGRKRGWDERADRDDPAASRMDKKHRPMSGDSNNSWAQRDSVISSPPIPGQSGIHKPKYDSDDQSSMMSEPGSPQDLSSADEEMEDVMFLSDQNPPFTPSNNSSKLTAPTSGFTSQPRSSNCRVATPMYHQQLPQGSSPTPFRTAAIVKQHLRHRHPQENLSSSPPSNRLAVPPPIDEADVPTPPSAAAEAAGSQLSMLSVNDMDMEPAPDLPAISIDTTGSSFPSAADYDDNDDLALTDADTPITPIGGSTIRRQRQRSGALSAGGGSSPARVASPSSPSAFMLLRPGTAPDVGMDGGSGSGGDGVVARKGLSMGFRADCEKCRTRVPGHMNHFVS